LAQEAHYAVLLDKVTLQWQLGDAEGLAKTVAEAELTRARQATSSEYAELNQAFAALRQLTAVEETCAPPSDTLSRFFLPVQSIPDPSLLASFEQQGEVARQAIDVEKAQGNPALTFGYFNQSLRPDFPLQGVSVGVAWPLWRKSQHARVEQAQVREQIARNEYMYQREVWENEYRAALERARYLDEQWTGLSPLLSAQAASIRRLAEAQWQAGEISFLQYSQLLRLAQENEMSYLNLVYELNQAITDLRFFLPVND
jgi:heavy metal efflux system protein